MNWEVSALARWIPESKEGLLLSRRLPPWDEHTELGDVSIGVELEEIRDGEVERYFILNLSPQVLEDEATKWSVLSTLFALNFIELFKDERIKD